MLHETHDGHGNSEAYDYSVTYLLPLPRPRSISRQRPRWRKWSPVLEVTQFIDLWHGALNEISYSLRTVDGLQFHHCLSPSPDSLRNRGACQIQRTGNLLRPVRLDMIGMVSGNVLIPSICRYRTSRTTESTVDNGGRNSEHFGQHGEIARDSRDEEDPRGRTRSVGVCGPGRAK
ncbi:uncharacterized protein LAESUDRAFT_306128 [Laetiporus sulphureus 93-53]|uniref:Uncharacterized protein n=1 Tax=Laetiporus sulphureus 93-53 TaxID=1314785 RepID=A0A165D8U2_9APHY|nr:uncharacterized protein LAESUDRAFT_306128 [Laetiporus sulphureus 93-53]KZT04352.1 hypothetical protein LAESUDRAFT_306128 [Laetiporus sulphureus 93-53]